MQTVLGTGKLRYLVLLILMSEYGFPFLEMATGDTSKILQVLTFLTALLIHVILEIY